MFWRWILFRLLFFVNEHRKEAKENLKIGKPWAEKKPGFVHLNNIVGTKLLRLEIFVAQGQALFIHFFCNNYL